MHDRMLRIYATLGINNQRTGAISAGLKTALHRFDEVNVFFDGCRSILLRQLAHRVGAAVKLTKVIAGRRIENEEVV